MPRDPPSVFAPTLAGMSQIDRIRRLEAVDADAREQAQEAETQVRELEKALERARYKLTTWQNVKKATDDALLRESVRTDPVQFDIHAAKREIAAQFGEQFGRPFGVDLTGPWSAPRPS